MNRKLYIIVSLRCQRQYKIVQIQRNRVLSSRFAVSVVFCIRVLNGRFYVHIIILRLKRLKNDNLKIFLELNSRRLTIFVRTVGCC